MTDPSKAVIETAHRGLLMASVVLASLIYAIDWTIAAVALPHMQGTFSATQDQVSWVLTLYIATGAIMMPTTGWLSSRFGRKRLFLASMGGFTVFSVFCGAADSLTSEVLFRVGQGVTGAFLIPMSQAIMLDIYPRHQHTRAMAIWGMGIMLGPVIGPSLGGYLTDTYSWRWIFLSQRAGRASRLRGHDGLPAQAVDRTTPAPLRLDRLLGHRRGRRRLPVDAG